MVITHSVGNEPYCEAPNKGKEGFQNARVLSILFFSWFSSMILVLFVIPPPSLPSRLSSLYCFSARHTQKLVLF